MTDGIHHITAIAADAAETVRFYTSVLGLRLVKKTVNQDDVGTYHLFFGDRLGHPGMDLTFFIFQPAVSGARGNGLVTTISLAIPEGSLPFWTQRFAALGVKHEGVAVRFGHKRLSFVDHDDQRLELVGVDPKELGNDADVWTTPEVAREHAIRNFFGATLSVPDRALIDTVLTNVLGYTHSETQRNTHIYGLGGSKRAKYIEVVEDHDMAWGTSGAGTVHHIAFRAKDGDEQREMREKAIQLGLIPTGLIDRYYFKSVYFRTPAGILFEVATDGPGFTADEKEENLGKRLALPPFLENQRTIIEANLPSF